MAAQEYYDPQGFAERQRVHYASATQPPQHGHHSQYHTASQHQPYNLADYKPAVPPNDGYMSQPPPPYSALPLQDYGSAVPSPSIPPPQSGYDPRQNRPQLLAPPQQSYNTSQQSHVGHGARPLRASSEPPEDRRHGRHRHRGDRRAKRRSRSRSRSRSESRDRDKDRTQRNTFLGAGGGAIIGDLIFPGLGTVGGAVLGGLGGHGASRKSRSTQGRKEKY